MAVIHSRTVVVHTIGEGSAGNVKLTVRDPANTFTPASPLLTLEVTGPETPYEPGEELTLTIARP